MANTIDQNAMRLLPENLRDTAIGLVENEPYSAIAARTGVTTRTVKTRVDLILASLDVRTVGDAVSALCGQSAAVDAAPQPPQARQDTVLELNLLRWTMREVEVSSR